MAKRPYDLEKIDKQTMKEINKTPEIGDITPNMFNLGIDLYNSAPKTNVKKNR